MIERFLGEEGRRRLITALRAQQIVRDDEGLAAELAAIVKLFELSPGQILITQGADDNEMYFVLSGKLSVVVNERELALRGAGVHVGEMALIDPAARRSASVIAIEETVVARVTETAFSALAGRYPKLWRFLALELASRLRERNKFVQAPNPRPVIFVGSSKETLPVAKAIVSGLENSDLVVRLWADDVFRPSHAAIEDLEREARAADFAVLVLGPDDIVISREVIAEGPRDNVIVELGMFMGALSRERTFFIRPRGVAIKVPSDLFGLTALEYDSAGPGGMTQVIGPVCEAIRRQIERLGCK